MRRNKLPGERFCKNPLCEARLRPDRKSDFCDRQCARVVAILKKAAKVLLPFGERVACRLIADLIRAA